MIRSLSTFGLSGLAASALLLSGCNPAQTVARPDAGTDAVDAGPSVDAEEKADLDKLAESMRSFHKDTTGWPWGDSVWRAQVRDDGVDPQVEPGEFTDNDKALFEKALLAGNPLGTCEQGKSEPCWQGPYVLEGTNMNDPSLLDKWNHKRFFTLIRPFDGAVGGTYAAPDGAVVVWSAGPDGLDQTGCVANEVGNPKCNMDIKKVVLGQPSVDGADDIVVLVGTAK